MNNNDRVFIFDTTLRDGEQTPGAAMTQEEKIRIALQLERLGVDIIEAGFAAASPGDAAAIAALAHEVKNSTICSLARASLNDVDKAAEALKHAAKKRIHIFIATSPIHMEMKLKKNPEEVVRTAVEAIEYGKKYTDDIEFSAEDSFRSDLGFLQEIITAVIEAGATTINLPDTVGYSLPPLSREKFATLRQKIPKSNTVIWSAHCHDDLGMAVANSIAAIEGGARQVECTINGIGERAGNASLEEIVMALRTRKDILGVYTHINSKELLATSRLVSTITGYPVPGNKAIVGANAFTHESGIHQDGMLKCRETYEILSPEDVGWKETRLTLGKLSGRSAFKNKLQELGISLTTEAQLNASFARFKDLADKKRQIFDEDLYALVADELHNNMVYSDKLRLVSVKVMSETGEESHAVVCIAEMGQEKHARAEGVGAVDAVFKAIEKATPSGATLEIYSVNAITEGTESQAEVSVRLKRDGFIVTGQGADIDIIKSSAKAYLAAINKLDGLSKIREIY